MSKIIQGSIVLVPFPYTDLKANKTRPAVVISNKNFPGNDFVLCAITSQSNGVCECKITLDDMVEGGLPVTSYAKIARLATIDRCRIVGVLGRLSDERLQQICLQNEKILKFSS